MTIAPISTRAALVTTILQEELLRTGKPMPVGYTAPGKSYTTGWVISVVILGLVFSWIALGAIQAPVPDYLVHPLIDAPTDPLAHFAAWVFGW